jgi:hypothetical protein
MSMPCRHRLRPTASCARLSGVIERSDEPGPTDSGPIRRGEKRGQTHSCGMAATRPLGNVDALSTSLAPHGCVRPVSGVIERSDEPGATGADEVRRLIAEGYSATHVAKLTGVSRRTVDRYGWRSASRDRRPLHDPRHDPTPELDLTGRLMGAPGLGHPPTRKTRKVPTRRRTPLGLTHETVGNNYSTRPPLFFRRSPHGNRGNRPDFEDGQGDFDFFRSKGGDIPM